MQVNSPSAGIFQIYGLLLSAFNQIKKYTDVIYIMPDGHSSELRLSDHGAQGGEIWNYKVDEIDISVIEELPPEIQKELWSWLRPHKRSNTANRGSTIARYFLPYKSS